jgi:hypothetical protein
MASRRKPREKDLIDRILDQIDLHGMTQEEALGQEGLLKQLTGKLLSRVMNAEMDEHLGYIGLKSASIPTRGIIPGTAGTDAAKRPT